jgi:uncharacterized protein YjbI with pentapeptide repeats
VTVSRLCIVLAAALAASAAAAAEERPDVSLAAALCDVDPDAGAPDGLRRLDPTSARDDLRAGAVLRDRLIQDADLSGVDLSGADLSGSRLCGVDLSRTDLSRARLDGTVFAPSGGGDGSLAGADLSGASLRGARLGGVDMAGARFDGADLRDAVIGCTPGMVWEGCGFGPTTEGVSATGADLRGAYAVLWGPQVRGLSSARLDGATFTASPATVAWLAGSRLGEAETVRLDPLGAFRDGDPGVFTGAEIRRLAALPPPAPARVGPGFDCARAGSATERAVCASDELSAMDAALSALWRGRPRTDADRAAQRAWLRARNACGGDAACLSGSYEGRIAALADDPALSIPELSAVFVSEPSAAVPDGPDADLLRRYALALGRPYDGLDLAAEGGGMVWLSAWTAGSNGHSCGAELETLKEAGALLRIPLDPETDDGADSGLAFAVAGDVVVTIGDGRDFCGMRAGWPRVFHRRPGLVPRVP